MAHAATFANDWANTSRLDALGLARVFVLIGLVCVAPTLARSAASPSIMLDPASPTLGSIAAAAGEILRPGVPPAPGPLPAPVRMVTLSAMGLVAGDIPNAKRNWSSMGMAVVLFLFLKLEVSYIRPIWSNHFGSTWSFAPTPNF